MNAAVSYHRVSTVDQNPELARLELRRAAEMRGLDLVEEIEETGSGAKNDRPGLQRVLALADRSRVSHVLVWKVDRFARSALDLETNMRRLVSAGVTFVAITQGLEVGPKTGATGHLVLRVLAAVADWERDIIRERTRLAMTGLQARLRAGPVTSKKTGRVFTQLGRPSVITSEHAAIATQLRAAGRSWSAVGRTLNLTPSAARRALSKRVCRNSDVEATESTPLQRGG